MVAGMDRHLDPIVPRRCRARALVILGVMHLGAPAAAQPAAPPVTAPGEDRPLEPGAPPAATMRYRMGVDLYRAGRFVEAAHEFRVGLELAPASAKLAFNLARALERAGRIDEAIAAYGTYLARHPEAADKADVEGTVTALGRIVQERPTAVTVTTSPADALVLVDDTSTAAGRTPVELSLRPGRHRLTLRITGRADEVREVEVPAAARFAVAFDLPTPPPAPAAPPPPPAMTATPPVDAPPETRPGWVPYAGWGAVGLGVAGLAAGTLFHLDARATADDARGLGPAERARYDALTSDVDSANTAAAVTFALGAALIGGGVGVFLWPYEGGRAAAPVDTAAAPGATTWRFAW
jgi:tetratricopeptide (TPR) repeat protein